MITREEYELLKEYRELGYKWIAREKIGLVYTHKYKPFKDDPFWLANGLAYTIVSTPTGNIFKSITWEDEEPTKIDDLINDYESHQEIKQRHDKVVIPSFVADWIEEWKDAVFIFEAISSMGENVKEWAMDNEETFVRAWLNGYEVEQEKLYTVRLKNGYHLCKYAGTGVRWLNMTEFNAEDCYKLTKADIESVDPRLMQFAEEVE